MFTEIPEPSNLLQIVVVMEKQSGAVLNQYKYIIIARVFIKI